MRLPGSAVFTSALSALLFAACYSSDSTRIEELDVRDTGVVMPTLRGRFHLLKKGAEREAKGSPRPIDLALGGELSVANGEDHASALNLHLASLQAYCIGALRPATRLGVDLMAGMEYLYADIERLPPPNDDYVGGGGIGPLLGVDVGYVVVAPVEAYVRGTASAMMTDGKGQTSVRGELGLRLEPLDHLELFTAYRWWHMHRNNDDVVYQYTDPIDLDLRMDGIVIGMGVRF